MLSEVDLAALPVSQRLWISEIRGKEAASRFLRARGGEGSWPPSEQLVRETLEVAKNEVRTWLRRCGLAPGHYECSATFDAAQKEPVECFLRELSVVERLADLGEEPLSC